MTIWPQPERLLPARLIEALESVLTGDRDRAVKLSSSFETNDALVGNVVRLVRGLAAVEGGEFATARAALQSLARDRDPAVALLATQALVDHHMAARRFAAARPLVRRLRRRHLQDDMQLELEALQAWIELMRRGRTSSGMVVDLTARLERRHPAPVHASVHLLRAEHALLAGDLVDAVVSQREARPYVMAAGTVRLQRRLDLVTRLLRAPYVEVEDWEEPLRPVSREEVAELESRPWRLWIDTLHRRLVRRGADGTVTHRVGFARAPQMWDLLVAILRTPRRRLVWAQAREALQLPDDDGARQLAERLARKLREAEIEMVVQVGGCTLAVEHFVFVYALAELPRTQLRILAQLAAQPGAQAGELDRDGAARRTTVRHLAALRQAGYVRLVGGGREARYYLV